MRVLISFFFIAISFLLQAQPPSYPQNYFRNPLGIPIQLAANFGELRPNHWHMGLDIRTDQKENLPVYASADGYIAHVGIRPQSFGRFIIINHPNGMSTLYGHLNDFFPELEKYVTDQQYAQESWAIELDFTKDKFPVTQSQFIAYSGNTGGSQGPHVHFEIRDTKTDRCLNPLFFGFDVKDDVPPNLVKMALYDRTRSVYEQTPSFFILKNTDSGYIIPKMPLIKTGLTKISFGIQAYDRSTGSTNPNGIYAAKLFVDEQPIIGFTLDSIDYSETEYMNAQIDYTYRYNGGAFLQHLSQLPGDHGMTYKKISGDGVLLLDTNVHVVRIEATDVNLNKSQLVFSIQHLDSLVKESTPMIPHALFAPNVVNIFTKPDFEVVLPAHALYDTIQPLFFRNNAVATNAVSALFQLNDPSIPVHDEMNVRIKPDKTIPAEWKDKLIMQRNYRSSNTVRKVEWQKSGDASWLAASFSDFGNFQVFADVTPPTINELGKGDAIDLSPSNRIVFQPRDNFGAIRNFRVELDGKWLRFTNDKNIAWIYIFDDRCPDGIHELKVHVEDLVGNATEKSWWFKKYPYTPPKKKIIKKKKAKASTTSKKKTTIPVKKKTTRKK